MSEKIDPRVVLEQLCTSPSMQSFERILEEDTLVTLQAVDVLKAIFRRAAIFIYDTGMGKTIMATAYMRALLNEDSSRKFIFLMKKSQVQQTPKKIQKNLGKQYPIIASTADKKSLDAILDNDRFLGATVLMLTHQCLDNKRLSDALFRHRKEYTGMIIDEAHNLNNIVEANSALKLEGMLANFEYKLALTATPIVSDLEQLTRLSKILDPKKYSDAKKLFYAFRKGTYTFDDDPCFFISRSREDFGIKSEIHGEPIYVMPQKDQVNIPGNEVPLKCKGPGAFNQLNALISFLKDKLARGERGLIYINRHEVREWILPYLDEEGIDYDCINGYTKHTDRVRIMHEFNDLKSLPIVITSVTEAIDLDCDWVLFYELTLNVSQMIGRSYRGLYDKTLMVYFMITLDTHEEESFEHIYDVAKLIMRVTKKRNDAIFDVYNSSIDKQVGNRN